MHSTIAEKHDVVLNNTLAYVNSYWHGGCRENNIAYLKYFSDEDIEKAR